MKRPIHILFADDEEELLSVLEKRIKKRGYVVYTAKTGEEALQLMDQNPVDVAVLDVKMPGMDGIETLLALKRKKPEVEVIMLSGHACIKSAVRSLDAGAFDYLMKPVNMNELVYRIEDAYAKKEI